VAPLLSRPGHGLLRCPICRLDLSAAAGSLVCRNRHSFDLAREGYVNLLSGQRHRPSAGGDTAAQLRYRAAFLDAGYLDAIAAAIAEHIEQGQASVKFGAWRVLDAGCGTGQHLAKLAGALSAPVIGLGLDISKHAARHASRRWPKLAFAITDLWREWPVHDEAADLVISIFAPKNFAEIARVLCPGGWLAVTYPGPDHLVELNDHFALMRPYTGAARRYAEMADRLIGRRTLVRLRSRAVLDQTAIRAAILMGPNARRISRPALDAAPASLDVTFDVAVLLAHKAQ